MGTPTPREAMDIVGSRRDIVQCLLDAPHDARDLVDALGTSRSTIYRGTRELESLRLIEQEKGEYYLTTFGRTVVELYDSFYENLETICELETPLADLPRNVSIPAKVFCGGEVVCASPHDPDRPVDAFEKVVRNADRLCGFSPVPRSRYINLFSEELLADSLDADLLTTMPVVEYMLAEYSTLLEDVFAVEDFRFFATEKDIPFELMVIEEPEEFVTVSLYDRQNHMRAFLKNNDRDAIEWGREQFEQYRNSAFLVNA